MSRSFKKNPIIGMTCAESEKDDKQKANRRYRRVSKILLEVKQDDFVDPFKHQFGSAWSFAKDGRQYCNNPKYLRK